MAKETSKRDGIAVATTMGLSRRSFLAAAGGLGAIALSRASNGAPRSCMQAGGASGALVSPTIGERPVFVSTEGDDSWSGDFPDPLADRGDGPVASLYAALQRVRAARDRHAIVLRGGDYFLARPVEFDSRDAGLLLAAANGEQPVLHGGQRVTGWVEEANGRWSAKLDLSPGETVGDLFVNGVRQTEARYPNKPADGDRRGGWLFAAAPLPGEEAHGNTRFRYHEGDLPQLEESEGLVAHIVGGFLPGSQWGSDTLPVASIDRAKRTIHTSGTDYFFTGEGSRYFLAGRKEFLDAPGEWFFDPSSAYITYIPMGPEFLKESITVGVLPTLIRLDHASGMTISGIIFRNGAPQGTGKVGTNTRGYGALRLERSDAVRILGCEFSNVGVGIHISESSDVVVLGNSIGNVAGNGIYFGTEWGTFRRSERIVISNNSVRNIGQVYFDAAGILFQAATDSKISHNLITETAQFAIAGGSMWGSQDACYRNLIEYNVIRNANLETADGGSIKIMGAQADLQAAVIRHNLVSGTDELMNRPDGSFWPSRYENTDEWPSPISWAIYLDGQASGVEVTGNYLRGNITAIGINGGWNNVIRGNVIAEGAGCAFRVDDATGRAWWPDWRVPNRIVGNAVFISKNSSSIVDIYTPGHKDSYVELSGNFYKGQVSGHMFKVSQGDQGLGQFLFGTSELQAVSQSFGGERPDLDMNVGVDGLLRVSGGASKDPVNFDPIPLGSMGPTACQ